MLHWKHCNAQQEVPNGHAGFKNVRSNIFLLSSSETLLDDEHSESARKLTVSVE